MPIERSKSGSDEAPALVLDRLTAADLPQALALSVEMKWPYRVEDWAFALRLGHGLALRAGPRVVATGAWWPNGDDFATVGMIIVSTALQGRGLGAQLFDALMAEIGGRAMLLNSTPEGFELYRRRGFMTVGEIHQHQGVLTLEDNRVAQNVRPARPSELEAIIRLDEAASGRPRGALLAALADEARLVVLEEAAELKGYAASRPFGRGHVVGPVIATDADQARALFVAAAADLAGAFVRLDTSPELGLGPWLAAQGLETVSTAATMVRGEPPAPRGDARIFALCSQSLG
jgi:ribosomal protein S18 acetylase RimI-like enzyme